MGFIDSLLLTLAGIYLIECLVWLPAGAVARCAWAGRVTVALDGWLIGNDRGGLLPASPLPTDRVEIATPWPISWGPRGVFTHTSLSLNSTGRPAHEPLFIGYEDLRQLHIVDRTVRAGDRALFCAATHTQALKLARHLRGLAATPMDQRAARIERWIARSYDARRLAARLRRIDEDAASVRIASVMVAVYLFALLPALSHTLGLMRHWWWLVPLYIMLQWFAWRSYTTAHRRRWRRERGERFKQAMMIALAPTAAMRGYSHLTQHAPGWGQPLALASIRCSARRFKQLAGAALRDATWPMLPLCPAGAPREAEQTEAFFRQTVRTAMIRLAETAGLDVEQVLAPPPRPDMDTRSYCPRCGSGFTRTDATCSTCGDRPAVAYA